MTKYLEPLLGMIGSHPNFAMLAVFIVAMTEAIFLVGLFVPSTVILVTAGSLIGAGSLPLMPIFAFTMMVAIVGDGVSDWIGHHFKGRIRSMWPFRNFSSLFQRGEHFFGRHGGKSIFIGRFLPGIKTVMPTVAAVAGMHPWRFTWINIVSSVIWTAAHLVPGILLGRAIDTGMQAHPHLLEMLLVVGAVIMASWYATRLLVIRFLPLVVAAYDQFKDRIGKSSLPPARFIARILVNERGELVQMMLGIPLLIYLFGFLELLVDLLWDPELVRSDLAISNYIQTIRSEVGDRIMVAITMLGDAAVLTPLAILLVVGALVAGRKRLAASLAMILAGAAVFVPLTKLLIHRARPIDLYQGAEQFSFPSGHAMLSTTIIGICFLLIAHLFQARIRLGLYIVASALISMISFSRLYLQAHWPSDVIAGTFFGSALVLFVAIILHGKRIDRVSNYTGTAFLFILLFVFPYHLVTGYEAALQKYQPVTKTETISTDNWLQAPWSNVTRAQIGLDGELKNPVLFQSNIERASIEAVLLKAGWQRVEPAPFNQWLNEMLPCQNTVSSSLSPLLSTHNGNFPIATLIKPSSQPIKGGLWVLRLWQSPLSVGTVGKARRVLVSTLERQTRSPLLLGFSVGKRAMLQPGEEADLGRDLVTTLARAIPNAKVAAQDGQYVISIP
ncbi:bifunctional DedA family/phosphatase PAP2 family protein [uncultured Cohaesibacter sp.]|uniref:bifunctional DedA family/phosphatase PAP2 family protein n=1 Tax=uncultured Cohaesibacter sp. TaxID=1002546 RepID=UPI0029C88D88|nr:bifunctional DedA family/phosphatase PAP2 family protein [uncultured Cohaesibacter sp.]